MDFKKSFKKVLQKTAALWKKGQLQRRARITYGVVWNVILFFLIIGFIGLFFVGGIGAGYFASLVKDEELLDYEAMSQDIYDYAETSRMYFANDVYFGRVNADIHRDETTLDQIAPHLVQAVIATEDEYFHEHQGIVPKAILRAMYQEVSNAEMQTGGSTLTQQLIKNQILTNEVSFERKAKEILLALRLERFFEKDEILEAYLNIVPYGRDASGRNIAGIQTAAQGIFGIDADEVNLAQAAYLAGLPQSPSAYTPFANGGGLKSEEGLQPGLNRMQTVLHRMYDMEYITEEQYEKALQYDIIADFREEEESAFDQYPILTAEIEARAEKMLFYKFLEEDGYTERDLKARPELQDEYASKASRALRTNGYEIHTTIDKNIYDAFQQVAKNFNDYGANKITRLPVEDGYVEINQQVQAAAVMIENSTGRIISFLGSREHSLEDQLNYTLSLRSNGSTMKPLLVYGPALEEGLIQPGTPIADVYLTVPSGGRPKEIRNIDLRHHGMLPARTQLAKSYNIPAVRTYLSLMDVNPVDKYLKKMGFTTLGENEYLNPSLAIGGTTYGIPLEENTNGFSTIANGGKFVDAHIIEKITTKDGEIVYEHQPEETEVFSPQTSYLLIDMMRDVISDGTAKSVRSMLKYPNVDWAGKTGTSQETKDVQFFASNPNITFGTWMGYQFPDSMEHLNQAGRNLKLWSQLINAASDVRPDLVAPSHAFQQPEGIVEVSYCAISGKLPSELCKKAGLVKTDLFNEKYVPTEIDDSLISGGQVIVNGKAVPAGNQTPGEFAKGSSLMFSPDFLRSNGFDKLSNPASLFPLNEDRGKWARISFPQISQGSGIEDDGKKPESPTSMNMTDEELTWKPSSSHDVVGYRVYKNDTQIGSTTSTKFTLGNSPGEYYVRAVDYFGKLSEPTPIVTVEEASEIENDDQTEEDINDETEANNEASNEADQDNNDEINEDIEESSSEDANMAETIKERAENQAEE